MGKKTDKSTLEEPWHNKEVLLLNDMIKLFTDNPNYIIEGINLNKTAELLNSNRTYLSRAVNNRYSMGFKDLIKYYRLRLVCSKVIESIDTPIYSICESCGFASYSSACNAFKVFFGVTPTVWASEIRNKLKNNEDVRIEDFF